MASMVLKLTLHSHQRRGRLCLRRLILEIFLAVEAIRSLCLVLSPRPSLWSLSLIPPLLMLLPLSCPWLLKPALLSLMQARPWTCLLLLLLRAINWLSWQVKVLLRKGSSRQWWIRMSLFDMICPWRSLNSLPFMISSRYFFLSIITCEKFELYFSFHLTSIFF